MVLEQPKGRNGAADPRVDEVQREVMTVISPDGRPPELAGARAGWRRLAVIGLVVSAACVAVLFTVLGATAGGLASILLIGYIALTVPVWGAGLLRGQEERVAHKIADKVVHTERRSAEG